MGSIGISSNFWRSTKIQRVKRHKDALLLALYLVTCRDASTCGIFHLSLHRIQEDTGLPQDVILSALEHLERCKFAKYDVESEHVWVIDAVIYQGITSYLDNRARAVIKEVDVMLTEFSFEERESRVMTFLTEFINRYDSKLRLGFLEPASRSDYMDEPGDGYQDFPSRGEENKLPQNGANDAAEIKQLKAQREKLNRAIEEIYAAYPRKVARRRALGAIRAAIARGHDPDMLLEQTKKYARAVEPYKREFKSFIPHASTWFNQDRFLPEEEPEWTTQLKGKVGVKDGGDEARVINGVEYEGIYPVLRPSRGTVHNHRPAEKERKSE